MAIAAALLTGCYGTSSAPVPNAAVSQTGGLARLFPPPDTCPAATGYAGGLTLDGDFHGATLPPTSQGHVFYGPNSFITPTLWLVGGAGIDFVNFTYWLSPPPPGNTVCKVDLDATPGDGSISETFNTVPGKIYHVAFWFSGSAGASQSYGANTMQVTAANASQTYIWNNANGNIGQNKWKHKKFKFKATGCPSTLTFTSLDPPSWSSGPVVTEISVHGKAVATCSGD